MFKSAVYKLTVWYVSALLLVCIVFSSATYAVASNRLQNGAVRQADIIEELSGPLPLDIVPGFRDRRQQQIDQDRHELLASLIVVDLLILGVGTYLSYQFAKRTLEPIEEAHLNQARFTADASHELRTPLATMQTEIDVALRNKKLPLSEAKAVLGSNLDEIARLRRLSDQLLDLTRLGTGGLQLQPVKLDQAITEEIKHLEKQHNLRITANIAKNVVVQGDPELLRQVLHILVDNAVHYAGNQPPKISVALSRDDKQATLQVTDQGIGIKPSELPHIFERFYRGSQANVHSNSGHGLGLSLAQEIIVKHHGDIHADSKAAQGATFVITLPL